MSELSNKEFNDLLESIAVNETFSVELTDGGTQVFQQLTTNQLKELVKTVVDSPLTQSAFNTTIAKVMKDSLLDKSVSVSSFNVVDRLLFCLSTRIESLSPILHTTYNEKEIEVNLLDIRDRLISFVRENPLVFTIQTVEAANGLTQLLYGVPTIGVENQIGEELYKNVDINIETPNELRKVLGEAFINEIAKTIQVVIIQGQTLELNAGTFKTRLKVVEKLPASLIQNVISFVEDYKKAIDNCLKIDDYTLPIDGSLFSLR